MQLSELIVEKQEEGQEAFREIKDSYSVYFGNAAAGQKQAADHLPQGSSRLVQLCFTTKNDCMSL